MNKTQFSLIIEALGDALEKQDFSILKQKYEIDELRSKIAELETKLKGEDKS